MPPLLSTRRASPIALGYAVVGCVWIVGFDWLNLPSAPPSLLDWLQGYVGSLLFVGVSACGLFWYLRRLRRAEAGTREALGASRLRCRSLFEDSPSALWEQDMSALRARFYELRRAGGANLRSHLTEHPEDVVELARGIRTVSCNRASNRLFKRPEGDRSCPSPDFFFTTGSLPVFLELLVAVEAGQTHFTGELPARDMLGGRLILDLSLTVQPGHEQSLTSVLVTLVDITNQKVQDSRVADALGFSETLLRVAPVGVLTFRADGPMLTANAAAGRIVGAEREQLLRQNFQQIRSWQDNGMLDAAREALASGVAKTLLARGTTQFGREYHLEATFASFHQQGEARLLLLLNDVRERDDPGRNLRVLHSALQAVPEGIVITDLDGRVEWVNPGFTRLTGYTLEEMAGQSSRWLRSGWHDVGDYAQHGDSISQGEIWEGELQNRRKDGSLYPEAMTLAPMRDPSGTLSHFIAIKRDLTREKQMEQQIARTQRLDSVGLLASGIAHDLNNVLTPIMLSTDLLRMHVQDAPARGLLEMLGQSARRGAGLLKQVLTFVRGSEGERTEVNLAFLLKEVASLIRETFPREIEVRLDLPKLVPKTVCDVTQLHQVIMNLAVNARDAMPCGGTLTLRVAEFHLTEAEVLRHPGLRRGPYLVLTVADTGTGMPDHVLEHIFDPFFTTKPRGEGTGLGLSTVYGLMRNHGGSVEVSTELGAGSEFRVYLPVKTEVAPVAEEAASPPVLIGRGRCILVVDDEPTIRQAMQTLLGRHGFTVVCAADGVEGAEIFRRSPGRFALAIVDQMMPRMNGTDLLRQLQQARPALPVIMISGLSMPEVQPAETGAAPCRLLRKPYASGAMLEAIAEELGDRVRPECDLAGAEKKV